MRLLVLSVDYEIFGNGSGDVRRHIIDPTDRMARICSQNGVPLTIFFEAEEYVAFEKFSKELTRSLGHDPASLIREQIQRLSNQGHDVQLHLHPQWHGAEYRDGKWILHPDKKTVDDLFQTQAEVTDYIARRKGLIEQLCSTPKNERKVRVYRAGAFSAQPGQKLLKALADNGILIDSSVVKGLHGPGHPFDYRQAPSAKGPWRVKEDVAREEPSGPVWEFPIYSVMGRRLNQFTFSRLRAKFSKNVPKDRQMQMISQLGINKRNPFALLKFLWQPIPIKLDFHNVGPAKLLHWIKTAPTNAANPDVVVLIGHTKEHIDDKSFARLVEAASADPSLKIVGFEEVASRCVEEGSAAADFPARQNGMAKC